MIIKDYKNKEEIILRDHLALERTRLANERTLLSYIRTSLYLTLAGIAFIQIEGFGSIKWIGYISITLSIIFFMFGIIRFYLLKDKLNKYYTNQEEKK